MLQEKESLHCKYPNGSLQVRNTKTDTGESSAWKDTSHTSLHMFKFKPRMPHQDRRETNPQNCSPVCTHTLAHTHTNKGNVTTVTSVQQEKAKPLGQHS